MFLQITTLVQLRQQGTTTVDVLVVAGGGRGGSDNGGANISCKAIFDLGSDNSAEQLQSQ